MKAQRPYKKVEISPKGECALVAGHPWVYGEEITLLDTDIKNGSLVDVLSKKGSYLGTGFYNDNSKICVRLLSHNANDAFDEAFFCRRIAYAWNYRKSVFSEEDLQCCRIIFGEADQLPGLTVDRFDTVLVVQIACLGMEQRKDLLFPILLDVLRKDRQRIDGIFERNDLSVRKLEGLEEGKGWYEGNGETAPSYTSVSIVENGISYDVDFINGQKTGFFLDQKRNRQAVATLARDKTVLDCFTHTGSFALNAAKGGAKHVTAVDVSQYAVDCAKENAVRNGLDSTMDFICSDVFDLLPKLEKQGSPYDFIILDPPAFTKSRSATKKAMTGYKEINYRAMKLLPRGGYLATCSCSHFATAELFEKMLQDAAKDAHVQLRQIEARQQCADHPILWGVEETNYLKFYLFQIV